MHIDCSAAVCGNHLAYRQGLRVKGYFVLCRDQCLCHNQQADSKQSADSEQDIDACPEFRRKPFNVPQTTTVVAVLVNLKPTSPLGIS